ncbi:hypothetical protein EVA_09865 [gut metagenome]|uniref:Uncharacterized protein n=1 Tax=gut metagenome TaxID=749906 RepID=J9CPK3_9ZZZZ
MTGEAQTRFCFITQPHSISTSSEVRHSDISGAIAPG